MRETDISKYTGTVNTKTSEHKGKTFLSAVWKLILTVLMIFVAAMIIVGISMAIYIGTIASEPLGIDLDAASLNLTSHIYVQNAETEEFEEYQSMYSTENRVWVDFKDIPDSMKNAVIAIEDKRFYEHHGVDWLRTASAIFNLSSGASTYGGSTLTQQLIKNITDDNEVSLTRKLREIFRALKLENAYTKDQILEAYLNVVNFGNNCQGVQSASQLYFGKTIDQCSIAECAAIAGITQNPSKWNPLIYPDNNKERRETVIAEMYDQEMISKDEYNEAMAESASMEFVGYTDDDSSSSGVTQIQNWYIDELFYDLRDDLSEELNISPEAATTKIYNEGLKVYCAMDLAAQSKIEKIARNIDKSYDTNLQTAMTLMGFDGRVIATVGSSTKKDGNLLLDRATMSVLQPGSSIKPVVVYPYAIEAKKLNYSSMVDDSPYEKWQWVNGGWKSGPNNWYRGYKGDMLLPAAIEISSNATAVQTENSIGVLNAYQQVTTKMGFTHLDEDADSQNLGALSIGGMQGGVTVREMAAAFQYMGNGGYYYDPYTYYYVTDNEDNIVIDHRDNIPMQAYNQETAAVMNRLLHYNITNSANTNAYLARVDGWDIIGKTGTTDDNKASWFVGASPYATLACWTGYDEPKTISNNGCRVAAMSFQSMMSSYLKGKDKMQYKFPSSMKEIKYCKTTGKLASSGCGSTDTGYYFKDNMPEYCYGNHGGYSTYNGNSSYNSGGYSGNNGGGGSGSTTAATTAADGGGDDTTTAATTAPETQATTAVPVETAAPTAAATDGE